MNEVRFAPELYIRPGARDVDFYSKALDAIELRRFSNEDGSIHVSELSVHGNLFHLHEEKPSAGQLDPARTQSTTVLVGLFVPDVDAVMSKALAAGATLLSPAQDYDYGYRQGRFLDPYGHHWMIEQKI